MWRPVWGHPLITKGPIDSIDPTKCSLPVDERGREGAWKRSVNRWQKYGYGFGRNMFASISMEDENAPEEMLRVPGERVLQVLQQVITVSYLTKWLDSQVQFPCNSIRSLHVFIITVTTFKREPASRRFDSLFENCDWNVPLLPHPKSTHAVKIPVITRVTTSCTIPSGGNCNSTRHG